MRLLKTHSHTYERLGYEARKNAKKINRRKRQALYQGKPPPKTSREPPAWRAGRDEERHYDKANHRQKPAADRQRGGGGARRRKAIEGKRRRYDKENQRQNPPAGRQRDWGEMKSPGHQGGRPKVPNTSGNSPSTSPSCSMAEGVHPGSRKSNAISRRCGGSRAQTRKNEERWSWFNRSSSAGEGGVGPICSPSLPPKSPLRTRPTFWSTNTFPYGGTHTYQTQYSSLSSACER